MLLSPFQRALSDAGVRVSISTSPILNLYGQSVVFSDSALTLMGAVIPIRIWLMDSRILLHYVGLGQFHVSSDGSEIRLWLASSFTEFAREVIERVLSTPVIFALQKRGALCLHASSVEVNEGAFAFMGDSGAGKSTLAAACLAAGAKSVADDVTPVAFTDGRPLALPMGLHLKLTPDIAEGKLEEDVLTETFSPPFEKHIVTAEQLGAKQATDPVPLLGIFQLQRDESAPPSSVRIEPLSGHRLGATLLANSYLAPWLPLLGLQHAWMEQIDALARSVPVSILHYGNGPDALAEAQAAVFQFLAQQAYS